MHRRDLLAALGAAAVASSAGCLGDSTTGGTTETPTLATGECEPQRVEPVDPRADDVEPMDLPEPPDEWTTERVRQFVSDYEAAYRQHLILGEDTTGYGHNSNEIEIKEADDVDYRVELVTNFWWNERRGDDEPEVHADSPYYNVVYLVYEDRILRADAEGHDNEPDIEEAAVMACW